MKRVFIEQYCFGLRSIGEWKDERNVDMKKALIVTHVSGFVPQFEMNNVRLLQEMGYEIHYASNFQNVHYGTDNRRLDGTGIVRHQVDFSRSPLKIRSNLLAYKQLRKLLKDIRFDLIHCHTPVASVITRLAAGKYRKKGTRVMYTTHGFHFYKGAPWKYWMFFYPIERFAAHMTDTLITINEEDFRAAKTFRLAKRDGKRGCVYCIDGVGIDSGIYESAQAIREEKRRELGVGTQDFVLVSVGELNRNKNHEVVIEALGIRKELPVYYLICGSGPEKETLSERVENLGLTDRVRFMGFREDVPEILAAADGMAFPTKREGLGLVAVEALMSGLPVIAADNRGTREYMKDGVNGYVVYRNTPEDMAKAIEKLYKLSEEEYRSMRENCRKSAERFGSGSVSRKMEAIYRAEC